ncbi:MAG: hypothetical protein GXY38_06520 [Planctomycetes bacterium]|nr:hypothetical protein [Planctomycetota bacterium]
MHNQAELAGHLSGFLVAIVGGLLAGYVVGLGMMGSYTHVKWPIVAGLLIGTFTSLTAPSRQVLVSFCGGSVAVVTAVVKIIAVQFQSGYWPITDKYTIAMYGDATQATMRIAVILSIAIVIPCLLAAALTALIKRLCNPRKHGPASA